MYYFYVIKNENNKLYYGFTNNFERRLKEHNSNKSFSTRNHKWKLVYCECYLSKEDAFDRERKIKRYGQALSHLKKRIKNSLDAAWN